ncbi:hypothetical protein ACT18_19930 [Mycolicibacter kumamotonensis]|uniref:Transposase n=1 Tax=Mycolicibacter kumamotonensis TaxID=354243 RepID=A0A1B8SBF8_9MYCO|nr:hypothetical protein ACT18_19930 [Mycolicibacter kumamotonensis]
MVISLHKHRSGDLMSTERARDRVARIVGLSSLIMRWMRHMFDGGQLNQVIRRLEKHATNNAATSPRTDV